MADQTNPLGRLVELAVYVPVGVALEVRKQLPVWARSGHNEVDNRVNLARMIGKFAVHQGRAELVKRLEKIAEERLAAEAAARAAVIDVVEAVVIDDVIADDAASMPSQSASEPEAEPGTAAAVINAADLPIADYDSLAASQVVTRLAALTTDELNVVADYELSHRGRRTILGKIGQLQTGS